MSPLPQPKGLMFDLDVVPLKSNQPARITMVGALRSDSGAELKPKVTGDLSPALQQLYTLSQGAASCSGIMSSTISAYPARTLAQYGFACPAGHRYPAAGTAGVSTIPLCTQLVSITSVSATVSTCPCPTAARRWFCSRKCEVFIGLNETNQESPLCCQALLAPSVREDLGAFFVGSLWYL